MRCHLVCLSVILLCYRIPCLWLCNKRFLCNKKGVLFVPDPVFWDFIDCKDIKISQFLSERRQGGRREKGKKKTILRIGISVLFRIDPTPSTALGFSSGTTLKYPFLFLPLLVYFHCYLWNTYGTLAALHCLRVLFHLPHCTSIELLKVEYLLVLVIILSPGV